MPWSFIGLLVALPLFMMLVQAPPQHSLGAAFAARLAAAELPSFGVMGATLAIVLSIRFARALRLSVPIVVAASALTFILSLPRPFTPHDPIGYAHRAGETGLFLAIVVALCVCGACALAKRVTHAGRAAELGAAAVLSAAAVALFLAGISFSNGLHALLAPIGSLGDTYIALLVVVAAETLLWTVGVHGPATLAAIVTPLYLTLQLQNTAAYAHHRPLPHIVVVSLFLFVFPGGAGATLPMALMLLFSKTRRLRVLARATLVPALFNINEPLLFGLPIVFNPYLAVPFIVAPLVTATTTYIAVAHSLVARPAWYIPAAVPSVVATYLATLDPHAVVLVAINIVLAAVIYAPFVYAYDRHERRALAA